MRPLDFVVIGTQKGGTTSLWRYLHDHPRIAMPELKEEPFFYTAQAEQTGALAAFVEDRFADAPDDALLGKATPRYMMGFDGVGVGEIARRMRAAMPDVRLIALLRDPIERAISHYRMSVRRRIETRSFDEMAGDLLQPRWLAAGRADPTETNSYLTQGEYGRVLGEYRSHFPADQLHVALTDDLARDPGAAIDGVLGFLRLPGGYRPPRLGVRYHRGGSRPLLDDEAEALLLSFMQEQVWPRLGDDAEHVERLFHGFYTIWNIAPDPEPLALAPSTRARLEDHYADDAQTLATLGVAAPWLETWSGR